MGVHECDASSEGCEVPTKVAKERRASLVIKETHELLNGLHAGAARSEALMAELQALLVSSQAVATSREAPASGFVSGDTGGSGSVVTTAHFASVQPLEVVSDVDGDETDAETSPGEVSPSHSSADVARRRSSTVYMDGSSLFANDPAGTASWLPTRGVGTAPALPGSRHASFTRGRASPLHGTPLADGRANLNSGTSRRTGADLGYAAPVVLEVASRRASSGCKGVVMQATPAPRTPNEFPSPFLQQQRSSLACAHTPRLPGSAAPSSALTPPWPPCCGSASSTEQGDEGMRLDAQSESEAADRRDGLPGAASKDGGGGGEEAVKPGSRAGSKRFMNLFHLKGILTAHKRQAPTKSAPQAYVSYAAPAAAPSLSGLPLSPTGSGSGTSGRNAKMHEGGTPVPAASTETQESAAAAAAASAGDGLVSVRRAGSLTGVSGRAILARGTSLRGDMLATSASANTGAASSITASAPARSVGSGNSYSGARSVQVQVHESAPSRVTHVPPLADGSRAAAAWPVSGANSWRSLACALPQI